MTEQTEKPSPKKLFIKTYGCQMNVYDSDRMKDVLKPLGFAPTDTPEGADLVVLNTCHIRERATEKVFSELGQLKRMKEATGGKMTIAVAGCVAQAEGAEIMRRQPAVDLVLGPQSYHKLPEMIANVARKTGVVLETEFDVEEKFDSLPIKRDADGSSSALVSIQEGCDKFCTFCVVPYTRGAEFSRRVDDIVAEVRVLAAQGVKEINLLGQNVNAFHGTAPAGESGEWGLGRLLRHLAKIGGLQRLRFTTSHPKDMDDDLISAYGELDVLMPHFHLPVQAGSDKILKSMNRGHTAEQYIETMKKVRAVRPDIAFASDFIVGFPGETDQDFEDTLALVREVKYASAYSFKYSRRPGTPGAEMFGQVDEEIKDERLQRLQALLRDQQTEFNEQQIGKTIPVLFTHNGKLEGQALGKSPYLQSVHCEGVQDKIGQIVDVKIISATQSSLKGVLPTEKENFA